MIDKVLELLKKYKNFVIYSIIGITGATLDFLVFLLLFNLFGIDKNIATFLSTTLGISNNFILNTFFNFKTRDRIFMRFASFYAVGLTGIILTFAIFYVFVDIAGYDTNIVKLLSIVVVVLVQYNLNKKISFRKINEK